DVIDQVLVTFFEKGRSFTGDETIEISSHGNPLILNRIIDCFLSEGCRLAERGEFSFRSFYNGKMDLVQAESVHDVVTAKNTESASHSLKGLGGGLSRRFLRIEEEIIAAMSFLEASIDFVEQDIEFADYAEIRAPLERAMLEVQSLVQSYDVGKNLNRGFKILLLGETNVGKSSLFNCLFSEEKAIVTDLPGTTRDLISSQAFVGHHLVEYSDSAGLRETDDEIEKIGVGRSLSASKEADLILYVVDGKKSDWKSLPETIDPRKSLLVVNKTDLFENNISKNDFLSRCPDSIQSEDMVLISALKNEGVDELVQKISQKLDSLTEAHSDDVLTQPRHFDHLKKVESFLEQALSLMVDGESPDLISQDLGMGLQEVHQIIGKEYDDEVLDRIFSQFCIGK
ncbi:MAG: tRNA uridine-5-carboxymethylaminomethyl(34) synthesis GTPase MnmE, partial [Pseudomonadota bacterium]